MIKIVLVGVLLTMGCASNEPKDWCEEYEVHVKRHQSCVDIGIIPDCTLDSYEARQLKYAKQYMDTHCKAYG